MRIVAVVLVVVFLSITPGVRVAAASGHGCAPSTPPPVSGSPVPASATPGTVLINEILLLPDSTWNCSESGTFTVTNDTWIELYNPQNQPLDLYTAHASIDSGPGSNAYYLPFGAAIAAHGYLVLFPRTSSAFVATETATLRLVIAGVTIDQVTVPQLAGDQSYARIPDGANTWQIATAPTIDANNGSPQLNPTSTPSPQSTPQSHRGGNNGNSNPIGEHGNTPIANGTQPAWSNLQLPVTQSTPPVQATTTTLLSSPTPTAGGGLDVPHRIALTLLLVALALAFLWCWRLFMSS